MNNGGPLDFDAYINNSEFKRSIDEMQQRIRQFTDNSGKEFSRMDSIAGKVGMAIGGYFSFQALSGFAQQLISVRGEFQKYDAILTNSLGSQQKATESLQMLTQVAATTPFQLDQITAAYVKLVNQGFTPTRAEIIKLGDLSSSVGKDFNMLAEALLDAQTGEFERLKEFGIKASKAGDQVTFAFRGQKTTVDNTSEAIRAYILSLGDVQGIKGSMEAISKTLVGQVSNLQDAITSMFNKIGSNSEGILSGAVSTAKFLVENYEAVGKILLSLVATYGAYKAAVILTSVVERARTAILLEQALAGRALSTWEALHSMAIKKVQVAQELLNKTMLSNPYVALATVIMGIVSALYLFRERTIEIKSASELMADAQKEVSKSMAEQQAKIDPLVSVIQDLSKSEDVRLSAYNKLKEINPELVKGLSLQEAATKKLTDRVKEYMTELEKSIRLQVYQGKLAEAIAPQEDLRIKLQDLQKQYDEAAKKATDYAKTKNVDIKGAVATSTMGISIEIANTKKQLDIASQQVEKIKKDMSGLDILPKTEETSNSGGGTPTTDIKEVKASYSELTDEIERNEARIERMFDDTANSEIEKMQQVVDAEKDIYDKENARIAEVLKQTQSTRQKINDINLEYAKKEADIRAASLESELPQRLAELETQKQAAIDAAKDEAFQKSEIYQEITKDVVNEGKVELSAKIASIEKALSKEVMSANMRKKLIAELQAAQDKLNGINTKNASDTFRGIADILGNVANMTGMIDRNIANMIGGAANLAGSLGNAIDVLKSSAGNLAKGGAVAGVATVAMGIIDMIDKQWGKQAKLQKAEERRKELNAQISANIKEINDGLEYQLGLYDQMPTIEKYGASLMAITQAMAEAQKQFSGFTFSNVENEFGLQSLREAFQQAGITISDDVELLKESLKNKFISQEQYDLAMQYYDIAEQGEEKILELRKQYAEYITGTSASGLVDEITAMFEQGKTSAKDFAETFEGLMKNAFLQSLKAKMLEGPLQQWFNEYTKGLTEGQGTSQTWVAQMNLMLQNIGANAESFWENIQTQFPEMFGAGTTGPAGENTLTGSVKGVSEETASLVAGQMNAMRMNQGVMSDIMRDQLFALNNIEVNTRYNKHLLEIRNILKSQMSTNSNVSTGVIV